MESEGADMEDSAGHRAYVEVTEMIKLQMPNEAKINCANIIHWYENAPPVKDFFEFVKEFNRLEKKVDSIWRNKDFYGFLK